MDMDELADRHPRLHHVTTAGAWSAIASGGLLSASALLDRYDVPEPRRRELITRPRPDPVELSHPAYPPAVLFDNRPLRTEILQRCLDCSVEEWCRLLNARVFFWATEARVDNHLRARGHRGQARELLTISTERLLREHEARMTLCPFNSGSALYPNAPRRGPDTFQPIGDYPYDTHRRRRGRANALAEVCIEDRLHPIAEVVTSVVSIDQDGTRQQLA